MMCDKLWSRSDGIQEYSWIVGTLQARLVQVRQNVETVGLLTQNVQRLNVSNLGTLLLICSFNGYLEGKFGETYLCDWQK